MPDSDAAGKAKLPASAENMMAQVEARAARITRRKGRSYHGFWRPVAMVGLIGWTVVVPMLIGIAVGTWIDRTWPSRFSWTLMLLVGGLGVGCFNAWARIQDEQEDR
jgi:ATP synthase protein I